MRVITEFFAISLGVVALILQLLSDSSLNDATHHQVLVAATFIALAAAVLLGLVSYQTVARLHVRDALGRWVLAGALLLILVAEGAAFRAVESTEQRRHQRVASTSQGAYFAVSGMLGAAVALSPAAGALELGRVETL